MYLADTSVWHWARHPAARAALQDELDRGTVATCAIIDAELIVSARNEREAAEITEDRRALHWLPSPDEIWDEVLATQMSLVAKSLHRSVKLPDLVIAAVARRNSATVLHYDHDYDAIGEVTNQPMQWLVPPGSLA
ncbi:PIN domain nuclease [Mycobacterium sp. pUA109]|uniref:PIN domain nuclease n=1 Tax=Mycobacterium sp. pUA109 TaxID=3238982 RepID=UPI00351B4039